MKGQGKVVVNDYTKYFVASGFFHNPVICIRMAGSVSVKFCLFCLVVTSTRLVLPG